MHNYKLISFFLLLSWGTLLLGQQETPDSTLSLKDTSTTTLHITPPPLDTATELPPLVISVDGQTILMSPVQGGTFTMGSRIGNANNKPEHQVTVSSFYMSTYEVTFDLYDAYCKMKGIDIPYDGDFGRGDHPVINVSWFDAVFFCKWLTSQTGITFRLPTEAEWEYAARGGRANTRYDYSGSNNIDEVAWYWQNSRKKSHSVGEKKPNQLGIYDLSGGVWEWCADGMREYTETPQVNPFGEITKEFRVSRGGSWGFYPQSCRVFFRDKYPADEAYSDLGIRLVAEPRH